MHLRVRYEKIDAFEGKITQVDEKIDAIEVKINTRFDELMIFLTVMDADSKSKTISGTTSGTTSGNPGTISGTTSRDFIPGPSLHEPPINLVQQKRFASFTPTRVVGAEEKMDFQPPHFRHAYDNRQAEPLRFEGNTLFDTPLTSFPRENMNDSSYFNRKLSSQTFMELPGNSTIVRSIANIDPTKSGVCLTYLSSIHVYKWSLDLVQLQKKHPHEDLQWGLFVSKAMSLRISAFNDANNYIRNSIISGTTLSLPNEQLFRLILHIVLPKTEQDWISDFKNLVSFRKLPKNQHEFPPDPTKFTDWYNASLEFIHEILDVTDFLASLPKQDFTPVMRTFNQKPGLMQLMYDLIPQKLEKSINDMIPYEAIIQCKKISDYTRLFIIELNKLNDCTENSKLNRSRLSNGIISAPADKESSRFGTGKYTHNNTNFINKHNNPSNLQIVPYKNPHEGRLHKCMTFITQII
jgi:hypothetical protein